MEVLFTIEVVIVGRGRNMHYVIGDVHGCYDEMMALLSKIESSDKDARFIFVGDFIDRGPQVDKVLEWCMENITLDGKYQSVRGNHEQLALKWYGEWMEWWEEGGWFHPLEEPMPETAYDFSKWADALDILEPDKLKPYMDFFVGLPFHKTLEIESAWGKTITFRIVHAFYEYGDVPEDVQQQSNIWKRIYFGNHFSDEIMIHGHTPTIDVDYMYSGLRDTKPGMVSYRQNDINVDGGCVFAESYPMYPVMLCAIRLEDLEEIYGHTVEECFLKDVKDGVEEAYQRDRLERYAGEFLKEEGKCRKMLLQKMGHPDYRISQEMEREPIPGEPQYSEDQEVLFRDNGEEFRGTIEIVNAFGIMGDRSQPYYDILVDVQGTYMLFKDVAETEIQE